MDCPFLGNNFSNTDWSVAGDKGTKIAHDFEKSPLQIMTDSPFGSGSWLHIGLRLDEGTNNTGTGGIKIELSNPPKYFITFCSDEGNWTKFTPPSCSHVNKTWTITKNQSSVKIECDLDEVVVYQFKKISKNKECSKHWSEKSGAFLFRKTSDDRGDTASRKYRVKPEDKTGTNKDIIEINLLREILIC